MKNIFKLAIGALALTTVAATAAPQYPFPQNKKYPHGYVVPFAKTDMIKDHYNTWKKAWVAKNKGNSGNETWILSPEGDCSTVSEAIAYGMMITVYMDDGTNGSEDLFKELYATWKNHGGNGGGMDWRIGCSGGTGSATDSDIDAALALVMASKQWNNTNYLNDAKTIISWIAQKDVEGAPYRLRPGSAWGNNEAFNPSYAGLANFKLFESVSGGNWGSIGKRAASDLLACQNSSTGLVGDWCDWNSHQPTRTSAAVAQDEAPGFYDDAARTPWRTAWSYYWYGDSDALSFNKKIANWLIPATKTASGVNSGYSVDGTPTKSAKRNFVSSTFSGGLGLATSSLDTEDAKNYMETVYKALSQMTSCTQASTCGNEGVVGEKYYPATLNLLYLLLMTGNMPNFYDMTGFTSFTPDTSLMRSSDSGVDGIQMKRGDTTVGISGFWNWGAYHDKYGKTKMSPDSGSSPIFYHDGAYYAEAVMDIGPEPANGSAEASAGKYPSAGIAMSFLANEKGVDLSAMNVKYLKLTVKSEGPIRVAVLSDEVVQAGGEPGIFIDGTGSKYEEVLLDMTPCDYGFLGKASNCGAATSDNSITILDWVTTSTAPSGAEILKNTKGLKFEVKDAKGGYGAISVKSVEFLDGSKQVIDPVKITGKTVANNPPAGQQGGQQQGGQQQGGDQGGQQQGGDQGGQQQGGDQGGQQQGGQQIGGDQSGTAIAGIEAAAMTSVRATGMNIMVTGAKAGSAVTVFNMQGKVIASAKAFSGSVSVAVPNKGIYMVRVGGKMSKIAVK